MQEGDKMYLQGNSNSKAKENSLVESYSGNDWGDKLSFTVGVSYIVASSIGLTKGVIEGFPRKFDLPKKLLLNNFFNSVGKQTSSFGQAAAAGSLMYYMVGSTLNLFFEDELANFTQLHKNILCGAITGGIYKSTLGPVPFLVGSLVGGGLIGGMTLIVNNLNKRGTVAFEMKF